MEGNVNNEIGADAKKKLAELKHVQDQIHGEMSAICKSYEDKIHDLVKEHEDHKEKCYRDECLNTELVRALKKENQDLKVEAASFGSKMNNLTDACRMVQDNKVAYDMEIHDLKEENKTVKESATEKENEIQSLKKSCEGNEIRFRAQEVAMNNLSNEKGKLERDLNKAKEELASKDALLDTLKQKVEDLEIASFSNQRKDIEIQRLQKSYNDLLADAVSESRYAEAVEDGNKKSAEIEELKKQLDESKSILEEQQSDWGFMYGKIQENVANRHSQEMEFKRAVEKAEESKQMAEEQIVSLQNTFQNMVNNLEQKLKDMEMKVSAAVEPVPPIPVAPTTSRANLKRSAPVVAHAVDPNLSIDDSDDSRSSAAAASAPAAKKTRGRPRGPNYQKKNENGQPADRNPGRGRPRLSEEEKKRRAELRKAKKLAEKEEADRLKLMEIEEESEEEDVNEDGCLAGEKKDGKENEEHSSDSDENESDEEFVINPNEESDGDDE